MRKATDGLVSMGGEKLIELSGFLMDGEVLLSDSDRMGDYQKIKVKLEPSLLAFWIEENEREIENITGKSII
jgi:hypothetical protein